MVAFPRPVIDFSRENLEAARTSGWASRCKDVLKALEEYGCFVAVYNNVPLQLHADLFNVLEELFDLPLETKRKNVSDIPFAGYVEIEPTRPFYESMGISHVEMLEGNKDFTKTMWPKGNDNFCKIVHSFSKAVEELHKGSGKSYIKLHGEEDDSRWLWDGKERTIKLGLYPASYGQKFPYHTILHQNDVNGWEIQTKNGEWVDVDLSSSSKFLVMAGEGIMGWSNNRIDACDHRVTINRKEKRLSIGLFSYVKGIIKVPEEFVDEEHPLMYKPFDHIGLVHFFGTPEVHKQHRTLKAYSGL
ncbi:2-oxoglutarate-dependent dioxygenase AOP3 [Jatropha curcas]|uniref:2-oxoglutarate-dependent dioxygenase AOP3 n=1 Tax=Jatropha curcas TaxID=180498 RepID=UPI001894BD6B|nr:2-oxoglutarate-dependent dioxygenase AOP3 [Jatropha curcas]